MIFAPAMDRTGVAGACAIPAAARVRDDQYENGDSDDRRGRDPILNPNVKISDDAASALPGPYPVRTPELLASGRHKSKSLKMWLPRAGDEAGGYAVDLT